MRSTQRDWAVAIATATILSLAYIRCLSDAAESPELRATQAPCPAGPVSEGFRLAVRVEPHGGRVGLVVSLRNVTDQVLYYAPTAPKPDLVVHATFSDGRSVPLTKLGKEIDAVRRRIKDEGTRNELNRQIVALEPKHDASFAIELDDLFELTEKNTYVVH